MNVLPILIVLWSSSWSSWEVLVALKVYCDDISYLYLCVFQRYHIDKCNIVLTFWYFFSKCLIICTLLNELMNCLLSAAERPLPSASFINDSWLRMFICVFCIFRWCFDKKHIFDNCMLLWYVHFLAYLCCFNRIISQLFFIVVSSFCYCYYHYIIIDNILSIFCTSYVSVLAFPNQFQMLQKVSNTAKMVLNCIFAICMKLYEVWMWIDTMFVRDMYQVFEINDYYYRCSRNIKNYSLLREKCSLRWRPSLAKWHVHWS